MHILAELGHTVYQLVLCRDQSMILEVIYKVFLTVFAKEVKLDLSRRWCPFEIVERLRGLNLSPAWP